MSRKDRYNRRKFLSGLGAGAALLPLLEAERSRAACTSSGPKRLVLIYFPEGWRGDLTPSSVSWWPSGSETEFSLPPNMKAFEPYKNDLIFMDGFDYKMTAESPRGDPARDLRPTGHHCTPGMFSGVPLVQLDDPHFNELGGGPTIDEHIGAGLVKAGFAGEPDVCMGVWMQEPNHAFWRARNTRKVPQDDPYAIFDKYFAGQSGGTSSGGTAGPNPLAARRVAAGKSLLNGFLYDDVRRFQKSLGKSDQLKIDQHFSALRSIEDKLNRPLAPVVRAGSCDLPTLDPGGRVDLSLSTNFPWWLKTQFDLLVAILAADVTRVIGFQTTSSDSLKNELTFPWLQSHFDVTRPDDGSRQDPKNPLAPVGQWHNHVAHQDWDGHRQVTTWLFQQFADLLGRLQELEGARLDNTAVVIANEMSDGDHGFSRVPWILAGRAGGAFKTGRNITLPGGTPQNGVLVALANAMDVPVPGGQFGSYSGDMTSLLRGS